MNEPPARFDRVRGLREALVASGAGINLATHIAGPIPAETMAAVHESDEMELRIGRAGPERDEDMAQREREARAVAAAVLKASPERIVLTHGTPEAARLIAIELLERRDGGAQRVLLLEGLDPRVAAAIRDVADVARAEVVVTADAPRILSSDIALVALAHVDRDGRLAEVEPLAEAVHKAGARLLLDASLSVGALPTDVQELGADFVIADAHRWLLGPHAMAIAWLTPDLGVEVPEWLRQACAPFARGSLLSLARSVGWLLMYVELPWAIDRTVTLAQQLYQQLAAIEGVKLMADVQAHGAVVAFRIDGWDAEAVAVELGRSVFAIVESDVEADLVRASVAAWNRERELERFVERVAEIALYTPETLPRRPSLTVLSGPTEPIEPIEPIDLNDPEQGA
jgi:selenocysteine lyase/cysteine desulfurase